MVVDCYSYHAAGRLGSPFHDGAAGSYDGHNSVQSGEQTARPRSTGLPPRPVSQQSFAHHGSSPSSGFAPMPKFNAASSHHSRSNSRPRATQPPSTQPMYRMPVEPVSVHTIQTQSQVHLNAYPQQQYQPLPVPVPSSSHGPIPASLRPSVPATENNNGAAGYGHPSPRSRYDRPLSGSAPSETQRSLSPGIYASYQDQSQDQNWYQQPRTPTQSQFSASQHEHHAGLMPGASPRTEGTNYGSTTGRRGASSPSPSTLSASGAGASTSRYYGDSNGMPAKQHPRSYVAHGPETTQASLLFLFLRRKSRSVMIIDGFIQVPAVPRSVSPRSRSGSEALPHPAPSVSMSPYRGATMIPSPHGRQVSRSPSPRASPRPVPPALPIPIPGNAAAVAARLAHTGMSLTGTAGPSAAVNTSGSPFSSPSGEGRSIFDSLRRKTKDKGKQKVDINHISGPISPVIGGNTGAYASPRSASPSRLSGVFGPGGGLVSRSPSPGVGMSLAAGGSPYGSDVSLPLRPGSPYKHYNPNESLDISGLASASAERLAMHPYR